MTALETHMNEAGLAGDVRMPGRIRAIAICIFRKGDRILAAEGHDPIKGETFYRPLGGSIEFGERSRDTLVRELREEAGLEIANLSYLGMCENIFTYLGKMGHEIVLVYDGDFADPAVYDKEWLDCEEDDGMAFRALWKSLDEFGPEAPLYPDGLLALLQADLVRG